MAPPSTTFLLLLKETILCGELRRLPNARFQSEINDLSTLCAFVSSNYSFTLPESEDGPARIVKNLDIEAKLAASERNSDEHLR